MTKPFDYELFKLEPRDIAVYEAILRSPKATSVRAIASITKLNRGTTFEVIKKLVEKGLVGSRFKNKRKYYFANSPTVLKSYADEIKTNILNEISAIDRYVSRLLNSKNSDTYEQFTQFYDGEEEIAVLLRDILLTVSKTKTKRYRVISSAEVSNHLYSKFRNFTKQRIKLGISVRVIGVGKLGSVAKLAETKLLTSKDTPDSYVIIYGEKVAFISLSDFMQVQGVLISNKGLAQLHSIIFDRLWEDLQ